MTTFYLTTPIYYVNDVPHAGHAYTTIAADVLARYYRGRGVDTYFLTGTDEHGANVAQAAADRGKSPRAYADEVVEHFREAWRRLDISHDYFIRTSGQRHEDGVRAFLARWHESGDIYKGEYSGKYCQKCERFYAEDELVDGLCPFHFIPPQDYAEENYFFRLSGYADRLIEAITNPADPNHYEIEPAARRNEVLGKLRGGLQDLSISRATLSWGVPLPFDPSHTAYVWIDALLNYITAIGYGDDRSTFERYWPANLHLMAKDILWFHAIIWPAMLISNRVPVPKKIYAHGFFTLNGRKMSKSLGNVISPGDLVDRYGADGTRYLLLSEFPFGTDGNIAVDPFNQRYNADLANDLGNLLNRTASMVNRYMDGAVPDAVDSAEPIDAELRQRADGLADAVESALAGLEFSVALEAIRSTVSLANRYVDATQPWQLAKGDRARLAVVLGHLIETLRLVGLELVPFMPSSASRLLEQIGCDPSAAPERAWSSSAAGRRVIARPTPLFPKIEIA